MGESEPNISLASENVRVCGGWNMPAESDASISENNGGVSEGFRIEFNQSASHSESESLFF